MGEIIPNTSISVVLAAYNGSRYIRDQLDSIVSQTKLPNEVVIVDDCSTDDTVAIIREYSQFYKFIRLITSDGNAGVHKAFELGLKNSNGDIVFLSDQDDVWYPNKIELLSNEIVETSCCCAFANLDVYFIEDSELRSFYSADPTNRLNIPLQLLKNDFIGCNMVITRDVVNAALPFPNSISMHDWWLGTVSIAVGNVKFINAYTMKYRRHSSNVTTLKRRSLMTILKSRIGNVFSVIVLYSRLLFRN